MNEEKGEALHELMKNGHEREAIEMLREHPELANFANAREQTSFWIACYCGHRNIVAEMMKDPIISSLNYDKSDFLGRTALRILRDFEDQEMIDEVKPLFGYPLPKSAPTADEGPG